MISYIHLSRLHQHKLKHCWPPSSNLFCFFKWENTIKTWGRKSSKVAYNYVTKIWHNNERTGMPFVSAYHHRGFPPPPLLLNYSARSWRNFCWKTRISIVYCIVCYVLMPCQMTKTKWVGTLSYGGDFYITESYENNGVVKWAYW
jgi:hypothetical protein